MTSMGVILVAAGLTLANATGPTATPVRAYEMDPADPMVLPSSVAVDLEGRVYVADGLNDRVVQFDRDGSVAAIVREVGTESLSGPFAVDVDSSGALWIVDERLVARWEPGGRSEVVIRLAETGLGPLDITDIEVTAENIWLVDNDGDRLLRGSRAGSEWRQVDHGDLIYPFKVAVDEAGRAYAIDALNYTVRSYAADGAPMLNLGRRGVAPGRHFRPRGLAASADGVWVSDGELGVVQLFDARGGFEGVLLDRHGELLVLDSPVDLEVAGDRLYVVERDAGRVRELRFAFEAGWRGTAAVDPDIESIDGCTTCHLEWADVVGAYGDLARSARQTGDGPFAGSEGACLSCHDGAVRDSRRLVWTLPGHPMEEPPASALVPEEFPLWRGSIRCRTCHSPHSRAGSGQSHRDALMLRVSDERSELCSACHEEVEDASDGAHPMGAAADSGELIRCEDCHVSHGASGPSLLPIHAEDDVCAACHADLSSRRAGHPLGVGLTDLELPEEAVVGAEGELLCATCHSAHRSSPAAGCGSCHPSKAGHGDADSPVACHKCHVAHGRSPAPQAAGDPTGCQICHAEDAEVGLAGRAPGALGHPVDGAPADDGRPLVCGTCHDPHNPATEGAAACGSCHESAFDSASRGGGHGNLGCHECHPAHAAPPFDADLFADFNLLSRPCLGCHADGRVGASQVEPLAHPPIGGEDLVARWEALVLLPLFDADGGRTAPTENGQIVCASCHLTHGPDQGEQRDHLRRGGWEKPCGACHGEDALWLYRYYHQPGRWLP